jgi:putative FmdB family regulatory protein
VPVFDFKCTACGAREEHIVLGSEAAPTTCSACGGALKRAYGGSRVHVALEGWGFSRNDSLVSDDRPRKDWKALKERADRIRDE